jgi:hypothetical protein
MISCLDQEMGRVQEALTRADMWADTLLIFTTGRSSANVVVAVRVAHSLPSAFRAR